MAVDLNKVAKPGDPDLDFDVDCLYIDNLIVGESDFIITFTGGVGGWTSPDDADSVLDLMDEITSLEVMAAYPTAPPDLFAALVDQLTDWRARQTPLRLLSAPSKVSLLMEDNAHVLPIPNQAWSPSAP